MRRKKRRHSIHEIVPGPFGLKLLDPGVPRVTHPDPAPESHEVPATGYPLDEREMRWRMLKTAMGYAAVCVCTPVLLWVIYRLVALSYVLIKLH